MGGPGPGLADVSNVIRNWRWTMNEREQIEFETPRVLSEVFPSRILAPEDRRKCSRCGVESRPLPASELTVIKHRHSGQPLGQLRIYCHEHL